ncbi:sporulation protein YhbH [Longirhabdus pacifica]|uniref:sporulation protein YhbH n=1 Tax=Longirhabdus pacifica TaxID=2305227 RepID=UPI001008F9E5|nr:sporulation protein YhbH [Longirhabdus pacifica]
MDSNSFIISKEDWSLHRKGYQDQSRHQEKVKEAIKKNLSDLITDESIILSNGKDIVKVPIRSLDEYHFQYNFHKKKHVGQGEGDSQVGDVIAKDPPPKPGQGKGNGAGDGPGEDYYEAEIDFETIEKMLLDELQLPNLKQKQETKLTTTDIQFNDVRKKGMMSNIDKKRTILENLLRNSRKGDGKIKGISPEDLRYKSWNEIQKPHSNACIIAMMDTSGSMGQFEKYVARSFFFWMTRFLRKKYNEVEIVYIAHHTEAKVVTEEQFFTKGESGGTICSSAYKRALEVIDDKFPPRLYNIYPFHFSDGDNLTSDNKRCVEYIHKLLEMCNMFGYGEVNQYNRNSTLMSAYRNIKHPMFQYHVIREKRGVLTALKSFFTEKESVQA